MQLLRALNHERACFVPIAFVKKIMTIVMLTFVVRILGEVEGIYV